MSNVFFLFLVIAINHLFYHDNCHLQHCHHHHHHHTRDSQSLHTVTDCYLRWVRGVGQVAMFKPSTYIVSSSMSFSSLLLSIVVDMTFCEWSVAPSSISSRSPSLSPCKAKNPTFCLGHLLPLVYIHKGLSKTRQYFTWLCLKKPLIWPPYAFGFSVPQAKTGTKIWQNAQSQFTRWVQNSTRQWPNLQTTAKIKQKNALLIVQVQKFWHEPLHEKSHHSGLPY